MKKRKKSQMLLIFWLIISNVIIWNAVWEKQRIQNEEQRIREENEIKEEGERFREDLTYAIIQKEYDFKEYYGVVNFYSIDDIEEIKIRYNNEWNIVKAEIDRKISDEDVQNLAPTGGYDSFDRRQILLSICTYNYNNTVDLFCNKDEIIALSQGTKMFNYRNVTDEIVMRLTNKYAKETYGITYEEAIVNEDVIYQDYSSKIADLYEEVCEYDSSTFPEGTPINSHIFTDSDSDKYHYLNIGVMLVPFDTLTGEFKNNPVVIETYKKYEAIKAEYEKNPDVKMLRDCSQKEDEFRKRLYDYNLRNPELVNGLCQKVFEEDIETFDVNRQGEYLTAPKEFEELVDNYLPEFF